MRYNQAAALGLAGALAVLLLGSAVQQAEGHGMVIKPMSRNFWAYTNPDAPWNEKEYNPTGMNGGGVSKVSNNRTWTWPKRQVGLCGEAFDAQPQKFLRPGKGYTPEAYTLGSTIEFHVLIHAHHMGRFLFRLCPQNFKKASQCVELTREDAVGKYWYLPAPKNQAEDLSPATEDGTFTWYRHAENDDYRQQVVFVVKYKLPSSVKWAGSKAVVQWYWQSGNTCTPSCVKADPNFPDCSAKARLPTCGTSGAGFPEEFWNCIDIQLKNPGTY